jgi:hypothetical protein
MVTLLASSSLGEKADATLITSSRLSVFPNLLQSYLAILPVWSIPIDIIQSCLLDHATCVSSSNLNFYFKSEDATHTKPNWLSKKHRPTSVEGG